MPVQNADVAKVLRKTADLLDIEGANPFRVRAYRNAARTVEGLSREASEVDDLTELMGIGKDLAGKIREIIETGGLEQLERLEKRTPGELNRLMKIPGLGPRRVKTLHQELGVKSLDDLKAAAAAGNIREVDGFGEKTEQSILEAMADVRDGEDRISLKEAEERAAPLTAWLEETDGVKRLTTAGSFRRRKETVGDLDILVACADGKAVMDRFTSYEDVEKVVSRGDTRSTVILKSGLHVDLRVLPEAGYGAGLHYFTGSKAHNIAVRKRGVKRDLKINEYGVFKDDARIAGSAEKEVFAAVDLAWIPPELREDNGEIEAAEQDALPDLVRLEDIRGDLHVHTDATDGKAPLEEMARAAQDMGYAYMAVTDHSRRVTMANGLDVDRLAAQIEAVDRLNDKLNGFRVLKGIELDILKDGSLDLPDDILKKLDVRVCSVHYHQNLSKKKQTRRILNAMENPCFNILAHPAGRIIGRRKAYAADMGEIMSAAADNGCFLELNADPDRLDLTAAHCRAARDAGVKIVVSTDAHAAGGLRHMRFGVGQARRGWLEAGDVVNTRPLEDVLKMMRRG